VYVCLDAALQEQSLDLPPRLPDPARFEPPSPPHANARALDAAAKWLVEARFPLIVCENLGRRPHATPTLCRLAEQLAAPMIDLAGESQGRPSVPSRHPLDMTGARDEVVRDADVVLALDVTSFLAALGQTDRATREVRLLNESARIISISLDDYAFKSWAHTFQSLAPIDLAIAADAGLALPALLAAVEDRLKRDVRAQERQQRAERIGARHAALHAEWENAVKLERASKPLAPSVLAAEIWDVVKDEDWIVANGTGKGWPRRLWDWQPERSYGGSGGAGLGYGFPAALGVTLAHRDTGKVCINLQADGDFLYVVSGLYTAAHHRLPLLTVTFNNRTYGNDEEHQDAVAKARGRPVENKTIGIRIDDPPPDFAKIAQGFGVQAEGPIDSADAVGPALRRALRTVKEGRPALVDVVTRL
jgi:thiamine pyrophosphate-dependent acetolactate synthase large subunit-like protein